MDPELLWLLEKSCESYEAMSSMIDRFIALASNTLNREQHETNCSTVALSTLVAEGIQQASHREELSPLDVDAQSAQGDYHVSVDGERITDCIAQIVHNANKFAGASADTGARLTIHTPVPGSDSGRDIELTFPLKRVVADPDHVENVSTPALPRSQRQARPTSEERHASESARRCARTAPGRQPERDDAAGRDKLGRTRGPAQSMCRRESTHFARTRSTATPAPP